VVESWHRTVVGVVGGRLAPHFEQTTLHTLLLGF